MRGSLHDVDGFIIDLDGTVYRGKEIIEGVPETVALLKEAGKRVLFLSNRGNISRKMCYDKLCGMGLAVAEEEIMLSSTATARYLQQNNPGCQAWVLGEQGLKDELAAGGIALAAKPEQADWLVITLHETLTYHDLNQAFRAVRSGARIIATNADKTFPGDGGDCIDVAGMIGAIVASTGKEVDVVIGKPSRFMAETALQELGLPADRCIVIGDSLESDIGLGKQAGMKTALVWSGSTKKGTAIAEERRPDWIWDSINDLRALL
jgi:arabinose operon protein AraL